MISLDTGRETRAIDFYTFLCRKTTGMQILKTLPSLLKVRRFKDRVTQTYLPGVQQYDFPPCYEDIDVRAFDIFNETIAVSTTHTHVE